MVYTKTSVEKDKILRNDSGKLQGEVKAKQKSLGLERMKPMKNQGLYQQLEDMDVEKNHIQEVMKYTHERNLKKKEEQKKAKAKSQKEILAMILAHEERKSREAFDGRRIVFIDGSFEGYLDSIRMTAGRVLLLEKDDAREKDGIFIGDKTGEKERKYDVLSCGEGCEEIEEGDIVMVAPYSGTEIISNNKRYRIVLISDVICRMEDE